MRLRGRFHYVAAICLPRSGKWQSGSGAGGRYGARLVIEERPHKRQVAQPCHPVDLHRDQLASSFIPPTRIIFHCGLHVRWFLSTLGIFFFKFLSSVLGPFLCLSLFVCACLWVPGTNPEIPRNQGVCLSAGVSAGCVTWVDASFGSLSSGRWWLSEVWFRSQHRTTFKPLSQLSQNFVRSRLVLLKLAQQQAMMTVGLRVNCGTN